MDSRVKIEPVKVEPVQRFVRGVLTYRQRFSLMTSRPIDHHRSSAPAREWTTEQVD